jgi:hypothetical protein
MLPRLRGDVVSADIAPDVWCKTCGWVILCPHTPCVPYPPGCITPRPPRVEYERTGNFLEDLVRHATGPQPTTDETGAVYAAGYETYWNLGWRGVLPLPPRGKWPPPAGFTGHSGADPSYADVHTWAQEKPDANLCLRLPADGVMGIDVDAHSGKTGGQTMTDHEKQWGQLPPSPRSSSRHADGDTVSGIRLYRAPAGIEFINELPCVDIIQRHHRYAMCWPSIHPDTGRQYYWYSPDGDPCEPPRPDSLPDLPAPWVEGLRKPDRVATSQPRTATKIAAAGHNPTYVAAAIRNELGRLAAAPNGWRNRTLNRAAFAVFQFVKAGHANEDAVRAELDRIATATGLTRCTQPWCSPPGSRCEIHQTIDSAWKAATPRDIPAAGAAAPAFTMEAPAA